jgi:hypothetical protein
MSPQTVNVLQPFYNEIVFPAAILQPPFYTKQHSRKLWWNWWSYTKFLMVLMIQDLVTMQMESSRLVDS